MKTLTMIASVACGALLLATCAPPASGPINPGDRIGRFLITTGDAKTIEDTWAIDCPDEQTAEPYHCNAHAGEKINVSWGVFGERGIDTETMWAQHTHEIFINDRPVNLEAFGTQDVAHQHMGRIRYWNIAILASGDGEISVRNVAVVGGKAQDSTAIFTFSTP